MEWSHLHIQPRVRGNIHQNQKSTLRKYKLEYSLGYCFYFSMNFIVRLARQPLLTHLRASFSNNTWKDRDQSAEKVFATQEQRKTLEKLLSKIEQSEHSPGIKDQQFQRSLKGILNKYKVRNEAFEAEIINLHRHG